MSANAINALASFVPHARVAAALRKPERFAHLVWAMQNHPCIALPDDEHPMVICGVAMRLGVGEAWMLPANGFENAVRRVLPMQRAMIEGVYGAMGLHRLHMLVDASWPAAARYARALGFEREFDRPARGLGPDGEDVDFYLWRKEPANG